MSADHAAHGPAVAFGGNRVGPLAAFFRRHRQRLDQLRDGLVLGGLAGLLHGGKMPC